MSIISYAQNHEDIRLAHALSGPSGFYIDVGANHPAHHSVTKFFYERGWQGINIEPLPKMFNLLQADRVRDINLHAGLARRAGAMTFYEVPSCDGWSTFSHEVAEQVRERGFAVIEQPVPVHTLAEICAEHVTGAIDFLKIDVEGYEADVIAGGDWQRWRPRIVLVEATEQNSPTPAFADWEPLLFAASYIFAAFDGLNRYYVRAEEPELAEPLALAPNVFDDYLPYAHVQEVGELRRQLGQAVYERDHLTARLAKLADLEASGPLARRTARAMGGMSRRFPWLAGAVKSLIRAS